MGIPHTAVGLFTFIILVGWLVSMLPIFGSSEAPLDSITKTASEAQQNIATSASKLNSTETGTGIYGSVTAVFTIIWNFVIMVISFIVGMFVSMATFITVMLGLPIMISGIVIVILFTGVIFALIKVIIPDR